MLILSLLACTTLDRILDIAEKDGDEQEDTGTCPDGLSIPDGVTVTITSPTGDPVYADQTDQLALNASAVSEQGADVTGWWERDGGIFCYTLTYCYWSPGEEMTGEHTLTARAEDSCHSSGFAEFTVIVND